MNANRYRNDRIPLSELRRVIVAHDCSTAKAMLAVAKGFEREQLLNMLFWTALDNRNYSLAIECQNQGYIMESSEFCDFGALYTAMSLFGDRGDMAEWLIAIGAQIEHRDHNNWTPLQTAAAGDCISVARVLIESGANVNARTIIDNDNTALMIASQHGYEDIVRLLLKYGADPTLTNNWGKSAVELAQGAGFDRVASIVRDVIKKTIRK